MPGLKTLYDKEKSANIFIRQKGMEIDVAKRGTNQNQGIILWTLTAKALWDLFPRRLFLFSFCFIKSQLPQQIGF